jgi:hypothetical protein
LTLVKATFSICSRLVLSHRCCELLFISVYHWMSHQAIMMAFP